MLKTTDFRKIAVLAAKAASSKKAERIVIHNIGRISAIADFAGLVTVESRPQLEAVEQEIETSLFLGNKLRCLRKEGVAGGSWLVMDYGGLLVHVMVPESRELYGLDRLYQRSPVVAWREKPPAAKAARAKPAARRARRGGPAGRKSSLKKYFLR